MKRSYYENNASSYGMSHTRRDRILSLIGKPGQRVLDVGCGRGHLGKLIRERGNWVGGVEISSNAAELARKELDAVWNFDTEGPWPQDLQRGDFDLIVLSEFLEHVFDPVAVLKQAYTALKLDGRIIITTPNFMTWTNRIKFLFGRFRYEEQGMFDFGHIRWFTYRYLREVLEETGFRITAERHIIFPGKLTRILKRWPSLFTWQFIVKAEKI